MINKARITVDDATRQVLDELSGHLAQVPPWAGDMRVEFRDAMSDIRDAPAKSLSKLGEAVASLGEAVASQHKSQDRLLAQLSEAVKALEEPIGKQQEDFRAKVIEALQGMGEQLRELRTMQASQSDVLLSVMQRIEALSRPWWKKLF